jgi:tight adherence protein B
MIVVCAVAIFAALLILLLLAFPGQRVKRSRLGIERKPVDVGRSMNEFLERRGKRQGLAQALTLAKITTDPGVFALRVLLASVLLALCGLLVNLWLAIGLLVLPYFVARSWVAHKGRKRQAAFAEQLPDTLQLLIASMKSGFGLNAALDVLTDEVDEPMRSEMAQVMAESRMGRDLSDALRSLSQRMDNQDMEWVVGAIDINRETGGNLAEILENVNATIRERQRIGRKVRTFTAEGKLSARILTALPFLMALLIWRTNPEGFAAFGSGLGLMLLGMAGVLVLVGWLWIRKIVTIKF